MSSYEIEIEVGKVIDKIKKDMIIKNDFDKMVTEAISGQHTPETIVSLFKSFLQTTKEEK